MNKTQAQALRNYIDAKIELALKLALDPEHYHSMEESNLDQRTRELEAELNIPSYSL